MPLAKSITLKRINVLQGSRLLFCCLLFITFQAANAQDNSPYSRYGLGNIVPQMNVTNRGMGGIAAGFSDPKMLNINYANPASYGDFFIFKENNTKKISGGRAILDVGINLENRLLRQPNSIEKFTASNFLVSHVMVGVPIRRNWGLVFGVRPLTRISYNITKSERTAIDSQVTLNKGDGGAYLPTIGTGFKIRLKGTSYISLGVNGGYLFGQKDISSRRTLINDSLQYNAGNFETKTTYGSLYFDAGLQFQTVLAKSILLRVGVAGNVKQQLKAKQDIIRETYYYDEAQGNVRIDSVYQQNNIRGEITYPSSYTAGFTLERFPTAKSAGWLIGVDYLTNKWSEFRFYGQPDPTVRDRTEVRIGGELRPVPKLGSYWSQVAYRAGFSFGDDYIYAMDKKLGIWTASMGFGLPVNSINRQSPNAATLINLAFEYSKRGNNDNLLKENLFRLSVNFAFTDIWFTKRKYD